MIKRLKELREKATPGPWEWKSSCIPGIEDRKRTKNSVIVSHGLEIATVWNVTCTCIEGHQYKNQDLIVETVNNLDKLIAVCEALPEIKEAVQSAMDSHGAGDLRGWELSLIISRIDEALAALEEE